MGPHGTDLSASGGAGIVECPCQKCQLRSSGRGRSHANWGLQSCPLPHDSPCFSPKMVTHCNKLPSLEVSPMYGMVYHCIDIISFTALLDLVEDGPSRPLSQMWWVLAFLVRNSSDRWSHSTWYSSWVT